MRGGDQAAYGELFERHRDAATRLARQIAGSSDADDLVSEAFIKVLSVLSNGGGPDLAFRAYLLTAVRRLHVDKIRRTVEGDARPTSSSRSTRVCRSPTLPCRSSRTSPPRRPSRHCPSAGSSSCGTSRSRGRSLPRSPCCSGMSANSVSALAYRAREGLRQAYLQMHMADTAAEECRWVTERLGARVRNGLSRRDTVKVDEHLDECARCAAVYLELSEVNSNLAGILGADPAGRCGLRLPGLGRLGVAGRRSVAVPGATLRQGTRRGGCRRRRCERCRGHGRRRGGHPQVLRPRTRLPIPAAPTTGSPCRRTPIRPVPRRRDRRSGGPTNCRARAPSSSNVDDPRDPANRHAKGPAALLLTDPAPPVTRSRPDHEPGDHGRNRATSSTLTHVDRPDPVPTPDRPTHTTTTDPTTTTTTTTPPPTPTATGLGPGPQDGQRPAAGLRYHATFDVDAPAAARTSR